MTTRTLLELDLSRTLLESPPADPLAALRARHTPTMAALLTGLREAAEDPSVAGVVAHIGSAALSPAQVQELGAAVRAFTSHGKVTACWTESFGELNAGTLPYQLAAHFDEIWLQPSGMLGLIGLAARAVFVREALDKLSLHPQIGQRQEYKSAADQIMRDSMSQPQREATQRLVDSLTEQVVATVSEGRRLSAADVRAAIDSAPLTASEALARGLVDRLGYRDELYAELKQRLGHDNDLTLRYVHRWRPGRMMQARQMARRRGQKVVAVVAVDGPIGPGRSGSGPMGGRRVGSDTVCAALRAAGERDDIAAVVLRVVSPGGSYVASDAIHREVLRLREAKPVLASMGTVAASGGYFVAMAAEEIVALPGTVTGSIGVLGGKVAMGEGLRRLGVTTESVGAGSQATMFGPDQPFDDDEWRRVEQWLDEVYADFTAKAAAGRKMPVEQLEPLARGRVWTGADAHEHGLVDGLGGLDLAVERAVTRTGRTREEVRVQRLPHRSPLDVLRPAESSESPASMHETPAIAALSDGVLAEPLLAAWRALGTPWTGVLSIPEPWRVS